MAIQRVQDKNKLISKVDLEPKRTYISGSWGVSGSIYVFPNRSETQKDNIDERLNLFPLEDASNPNWDGTKPSVDDIIRPFSGDSLEARRIEIYEGNFNKFDQTLVDSVAWEYEFVNGTGTLLALYNSLGNEWNVEVYTPAYDAAVTAYFNDTGINENDPDVLRNQGYLDSDLFEFVDENDPGSFPYPFPFSIDTSLFGPTIVSSKSFGDDINEWIEDDPNGIFGVSDAFQQYSPYADSNGNQIEGKRFVWTSNGNWQIDGEPESVYTRLPTSDMDRSALNYEVPLSLLLDGADPETQDHAWRRGVITEVNNGTPNYSLGNSSLTGANPEFFQFTGWNYEMVNGFPVQTSTITTKDEVNAWPPEIEKWQANVVTNYMIQGYSDLSMHPRNKTQKFIKFEKSNHDYFSDASVKQRMLYREFQKRGLYEEGWWAHNSHVLNLSSWTDLDGTTRNTALMYNNSISSKRAKYMYEIDYPNNGEFTIEFWVKPLSTQSTIGTIAQFNNNFAILLIPDGDSVVNGITTRFSISFRVNSAAADTLADVDIEGAVDFRDNGGTQQVYISDSYLRVNEWAHVVLRWSPNFNNGQFTTYINNVVVDEFDGVNDGSRSGLIDFSNAVSPHVRDSLFVGSWPSDGNQQDMLPKIAHEQRGIAVVANNPNHQYTDPNTGLPTRFDVRYPLLSELTEFRCFSYPKTELEITNSWKSRAKSLERMRWYIPFWFDKNVQPEIKKKLIPGQVHEDGDYDPSVSLEDIFYGELADLNTSFDDRQQTPYCQNWGHVGGVPFVNVGAHAKEYCAESTPIVVNIPDWNLIDKEEVYPSFDTSGGNHQFSIEKIGYLQKHYSQIPWLTCWNSLMQPCDLSLSNSANSIISVGNNTVGQYESLSYISYDSVENIGSFDSNGEFNLGSMSENMFEDERFRQGTFVGTDEDDDKTLEFWNQEPKLNGQDVEMALNEIGGGDVLPPFSTLISIPIIYYGNRVSPGSVSLKSVINHDGKEINIVDNRYGTLCIANPDGEPTLAKVGHIDYDFGYMCIFSHLLTNLTNNDVTLEFRGEKSMHVLQYDVRCPPGLANESKNSNYKSLRPTSNANESDSLVTYISTIYLHDENLNVIGKVKLAQPIQKREEDSFLFRIKMDF